MLLLSLSLLKSKIASSQVKITQNQNPHIQNPPTIHAQRIPIEFSKNSNRILKEFSKNSQRILINSQTKPINSQRIPKQILKNSQRIPKECPNNCLQNSQKKILTNYLKYLIRAYRSKSFSSLFNLGIQ